MADAASGSAAYRPLDQERREVRVFKLLPPVQSIPSVKLLTVSLDDWTEDFRAAYNGPPPFQIASETYTWERRLFDASPALSIADKTQLWLKECFAARETCADHIGIEFPNWRLDASEIHASEIATATHIGLTPGSQNRAGDPQDQTFRVRNRYSWGDFEAISYCWGLEKCDIYVDEAPYLVPANLSAALARLYHLPECRDIFFWADAISIAQDDLAEKTHQVAMMRHIFGCALSVIVWLGPDDLNQRSSSGDLASLSCKLIRRPDRLQENPDAEQLAWTELITSDIWGNTLHLFSREYWARLWVLQELALNQNMTLFVAGQRQLPRTALLALADLGTEKVETIHNNLHMRLDRWTETDTFEAFEHVRSVLGLRRMNEISIQSRSLDIVHIPGWYFPQGLTQVLDLAQKAQCSDPRDKVFGLAGLIFEHLGATVLPDYNATMRHVFTNFATSLFEIRDLETVLAWCSGVENSNLPSWVPDWTQRFPRNHVRWLRNREASGVAKQEASIQGSCLKSRGTLLDTVLDVSTKSSSRAADATDCAAPSESSSMANRYGGKAQTSLALSLTLLMDHRSKAACPTLFRKERGEHAITYLGNLPVRLQECSTSETKGPRIISLHDPLTAILRRLQESGYWDDFEEFHRLNANMKLLGFHFSDFFLDASLFDTLRQDVVGTHILRLTDDLIADTKGNMRCAMVALRGRQLATTKTGWLALVPESTHRGDRVAVLYGCGFPVVLRPSGNGFRYIGECYIHGLMNGELFTSLMSGTFEEREVVLI